MFNHKTYIVLFFLAAGTSAVLTPLVIRLALKVGAVDLPGNRKIHRKAVPLLGGLGIAGAMWLPIVLLSAYENQITTVLWDNRLHLVSVILAGLCMLVVGIADDLRGLTARTKLFVQVPVALALVSAGIHFTRLGIPFVGPVELGPWAIPLSLLWVIGVTNALNLVDGMDGLAAGIALCASVTNAVISIYHNNALEAVMMCALAGACFGFLFYNASPARVFLGDTGSLFLGMTLAVSSILSSQKAILGSSMLLPTLVMGYPVIDTLLSIARRAYRGKALFSGDASHIHHRLLRQGLTPRRATAVIYGACILFSAVALAVMTQSLVCCIIGVCSIVATMLCGFYYLGYVAMFKGPRVHHDRLMFKCLYSFTEMMKAKLQLASDVMQIEHLLKHICLELGTAGFEILRLSDAHSPGWNHRWLCRSKLVGTPRGCPEKELEEEVHEFPERGISIRFYYLRDGIADEVRLETRNLLASLAESANSRITELELGQGKRSATTTVAVSIKGNQMVRRALTRTGREIIAADVKAAGDA